MSVSICIKNALKRYGNNTIIDNLSLSVREGEFFTLLGPSGCGKTTLLRMIAGFNTIEGGEFYFGEKLINDIDPAKRNIGMVFQNYAIFPHLTVRKNIEFGLKNRKYKKEDIIRETDRFLKLMQIEEYKDRLPERLSGGQQQRVALARALVVKPDVLLMDEPLSNLDAKLRVEMRRVIKELQNNLNITTIYVTHDQEEAMAISDRIAVMKQGSILQIGSPRQLYQRPANLFVATFIGRTNILEAELLINNKETIVSFKNGYKIKVPDVYDENKKNSKVLVSVRPEGFIIEKNGTEGLPAIVEDNVFLGQNTHYFVKLDTGEKIELIQESAMNEVFGRGERISLWIKKDNINLFSEDGEKNLLL